jgi:amino acid permease
MSETKIGLAPPTPKDLRRAGIAIVSSTFVTWLFGLHFYLMEGDESKNFAFLFFVIGFVDLFVGIVVLLFANRGGSPWANPRPVSEKESGSAKEQGQP